MCPWNKFARRSQEAALAPREGLSAPDLVALARLDDAAFRLRFAGTAIKRTGRDRFVRNVAIALGNTRDRSVVPVILDLARDHSPLVRAMAVWALGEVCAPAEVARVRARHLPGEPDAEVRAEWAAAVAA